MTVEMTYILLSAQPGINSSKWSADVWLAAKQALDGQADITEDGTEPMKTSDLVSMFSLTNGK
ncbi:hypothetical protein MUK42_34163 [Musa troglodytarum]|uniref:Uncharacterized protein n=1 Tax=Musa troglodytarum TaxID=320322 RepID=A0A9E7JUU8_9LILI|nr:hypothetical protein MUK42_34163 [Musa troglodytarum]